MELPIDIKRKRVEKGEISVQDAHPKGSTDKKVEKRPRIIRAVSTEESRVEEEKEMKKIAEGMKVTDFVKLFIYIIIIGL